MRLWDVSNDCEKPNDVHSCCVLSLQYNCVMNKLSFKVVRPAQTINPPRSGHCIAVPKEGSSTSAAVVFGGYAERPDKTRCACNDLWGYHAAAATWEPIPTQGEQPRARIAAQLVAVDDPPCIWLIGGWDPEQKGDGGPFLNDVWRLDTATWTWEQVHVKGDELEPTSRFQALAVGRKIYIHTHRCSSYILVLDTETYELQRQAVAGEAPSSRGLHSMTALGGCLYVFGGAPQRGAMLNDLWQLDLGSHQWTQLQPQGEAPHVRCSHGAAAVGSCIYFWGGSFYKADGSGLQGLNDTFIYDSSSNRWLYPQVEGDVPSPRNAAVMAALRDASGVNTPSILVQGGWKAFVETYNDTYMLDVAH